MGQRYDEILGYSQDRTITEKAILAIWVLFLISLCFAGLVFILTMPAGATEINPSVDNQPIQCRYTLTKWLCDTGKTGAIGLQGINGTPGLPGESNFTAIYYNATNFTARSNITYFINSTSFNVTSNYTVFNGASFYNMTAINESYAYLPGRAGGQTLNGGINAGDDLILNASTNGVLSTAYILMQPNGGYVGVGSTAPSSKLEVRDIGGGRVLLGQWIPAPGYGAVGFGSSLSNSDANICGSVSDPSLYIFSRAGGRVVFGQAGRSNNIFYGPILGVGYTSIPSANLSVIGSVRFTSFGAGTATFDAGGNLTSVSDSKAKTNIAPYSSGLAQVLQLAPKQYKYSPDSGLDTKNTYVGFIAQDVEKVLPDAVKTKDDVKYEQKLSKKGATADEDEYTTVEVKTGTQTKSLDDRAIIAALVNAVKEQQTEIDALKARIDKLENPK